MLLWGRARGDKKTSLQELTKTLGMIQIPPVRGTGDLAELSWISGSGRPPANMTSEPYDKAETPHPTPTPFCLSVSRCEQPGRS